MSQKWEGGGLIGKWNIKSKSIPVGRWLPSQCVCVRLKPGTAGGPAQGLTGWEGYASSFISCCHSGDRWPPVLLLTSQESQSLLNHGTCRQVSGTPGRSCPSFSHLPFSTDEITIKEDCKTEQQQQKEIEKKIEESLGKSRNWGRGVDLHS